ncbi:MAG: hypothetical protein ACLTC4_12360 [Hungatella hathewayi]|uniref:Uncharacterized protein n=1 Tax=Hungatella hathewayi WAL-18680 TaxID=742737 RepID=G5IL09_9FIRM|nr:hypothetical protein [Hungatella hathewayi]EHI57848.1 hypothetical protein HMPREF9473_04187 [ [Hungatella hathewayi WAL-18680]MBS4985543.1 hypothetical protein [Hungatella hathewayi]
MTNVFFPEEEIEKDDLYFVCYMIERVARRLKKRNSYVVNAIGKEELAKLLSLANVLHSENPVQVEDEWIDKYSLTTGEIDVTVVDRELVTEIPRPTQMGKVYQRLILDTMMPDEDYADGIIRVYNHELCDTIDNYNCSAYYEPSYVIAKAFHSGGF